MCGAGLLLEPIKEADPAGHVLAARTESHLSDLLQVRVRGRVTTLTPTLTLTLTLTRCARSAVRPPRATACAAPA